ncbi:hypothetical protein ILUMI_13118 [Ignelater luminosus]|uniref:Uncharacterized protein n=1 Tax=Ignelater luminosus TaxID=2038154 RepID=A0A8K0CSU9_IGNLU|nr:hypothetical protein ILUMI_13118 [Ignelater luminosus]
MQKKRQSVVYVPEQWITLMRMAKTNEKIYHVTEMSQADFLNFKKFTEYEFWKMDTKNELFKISQIKEFNFLPTESENVYFKYEYKESGYRGLGRNQKHKGRHFKSLSGLQQLYGNEFSVDDKKLKGILWLHNTGKIPTMYISQLL